MLLPDNKTEPPVVSVIYPLPPAATWSLSIAQPLQSVFDQTFQAYEVIVLGDGADQSVHDAMAYLQRDEPRLKYVNFKESLGLTALQLNEGLKMATGTFVTYIYSEVLWKTDALSTLIQAIQAYNKPAVAYVGPPFNYNDLHFNNFIPRHVVIHHKDIVYTIGGFEYHIAARKFYEWDFWIRCAQRYPFIQIGHNIVLSTPRSINVTNTSMRSYHVMTSRIFQSIDRSERLHLNRMTSFNVDDTTFLNHSLHHQLVDYIYEYEMLPWLCTQTGRSVKKVVNKPRNTSHLLVAIQHMDASYEIIMANYSTASKNKYVPTYFYKDELNETALQAADAVVLLRLTNHYSLGILNKAIQFDKPVMYILDDDLLGIHELGDYAYMAPGTETYNTIISLISQADIAVTYSPIVSEVIRTVNPRVVEQKTNILEKYIKNKQVKRRKPNTSFRIGIVNTGSRSDELIFIWTAIARLSAELGETVSFYIWGHLPEGLAPLHSPVYVETATYSYYEYLERLSTAEMDLLLVPLFNNIRARRAKAPIKYLETTAAGCIGLYSNNETYEAVQQGSTGFKINNTIEDWHQAMKNIVEMPEAQRTQMWLNAKRDVLDNFTTESQVDQFEAMLDIARFHSLTRRVRVHHGKPKIAVLLHPQQGGRDNFDCIHSLAQYGVNIAWRMPESVLEQKNDDIAAAVSAFGGELEYLPNILFEYSDDEQIVAHAQRLVDALVEWLREGVIALVHCSVNNAIVQEAAKRANIPCIVHACESDQLTHLLKEYNSALQRWAHHV